MANDMCFLLWRHGDLVVAKVLPAPHGEPDRVWLDGQQCRPLDLFGFFDHFLRPDPRRIIGFELFLLSNGGTESKTFEDFLKARNVKAWGMDGDLGVFEIMLREDEPYEDDAAQGFGLEGFVSPDGRIVFAIPQWDESLQIGFDNIADSGPTLSQGEKC